MLRATKASLADRRVATGFWLMAPRARVITALLSAAAWPATARSRAAETALASEDISGFPLMEWRATRRARRMQTPACGPRPGTPRRGGVSVHDGVVHWRSGRARVDAARNSPPRTAAWIAPGAPTTRTDP